MLTVTQYTDTTVMLMSEFAYGNCCTVDGAYRSMGLIWPMNGSMVQSHEHASNLWVGKKNKPVSNDRNCRHVKLTGNVTAKIANLPMGTSISLGHQTGYVISAPGKPMQLAVGYAPYTKSASCVYDDGIERIFTRAWVEGDCNFTSYLVQLWRPDEKRWQGQGIGCVFYCKLFTDEARWGQCEFTSHNADETVNHWSAGNYTVLRWYDAIKRSVEIPIVRQQEDLDLNVSYMKLNESLPDRWSILGDISARSIASIRAIDSSLITDLVDNVMDLATGGLKPLILSQVKGIKEVGLSASRAYLLGKYGVYVPGKSIIQSIHAYAKGVKSAWKPTKCYASAHVYSVPITSVYRCRLSVDPLPYEVLRICDQLNRLSFGVNLKDIWDLIPLSFVVDWMWSVDSYLTTSERRTDMQRYNIRCASYSIKSTLALDLEQVVGRAVACWDGNVELVDYQRWTAFKPYLPEYSFAVPSIDGISENWLDFSALVVARMCK